MANDEPTAASVSGAPIWVTMDGIVEGRIADWAILTNAVRELNALGLCQFELDRDGGKFTVLPDNTQVAGRGFDEARQAQLLQQLTTLVTGANGAVESTLRCTMVYEAETAETMFRAAPPPPRGPGIEPLTRVRPRQPADAPAEAPPALPWRKALMRREVLIALPLLVLAFALSAWQTGLLDRLLSANAQGVTVDTGAFGQLLQAEVENDWGNYKITILRGPDHPETTAAWEQLAAAAEGESERLHAVVVREGQDLYVQLHDASGEVLAQKMVGLRPLVTAEDGSADVSLPGHMTAARVVLSVTKYEKK